VHTSLHDLEEILLTLAVALHYELDLAALEGVLSSRD